jgi:hypothetical protein
VSFIPDKEEVDEAEANGDVKLMRVFFETAAKERLSLMYQLGEMARGRERTIVVVQGHEAAPDTPSACLLTASFRLRELATGFRDKGAFLALHCVADDVLDAARIAVGYFGRSGSPPIMPYSNVWEK